MDEKDKLSAGICDLCDNCIISNLGGGATEPNHFAGFCLAYKDIIEPVPKDMQLTECPKHKYDVIKHAKDLPEAELKETILNILKLGFCPKVLGLKNTCVDTECFDCWKIALLTANKEEVK